MSKPTKAGGNETTRLIETISKLTEQNRVLKDAYTKNHEMTEALYGFIYSQEKVIPSWLVVDVLRILNKRKVINMEQL